MTAQKANNAPAPNRRPGFPHGGLTMFVNFFFAPPPSRAAVGEAPRYCDTRLCCANADA